MAFFMALISAFLFGILNFNFFATIDPRVWSLQSHCIHIFLHLFRKFILIAKQSCAHYLRSLRVQIYAFYVRNDEHLRLKDSFFSAEPPPHGLASMLLGSSLVWLPLLLAAGALRRRGASVGYCSSPQSIHNEAVSKDFSDF